jgi:hypothetical protein
MTSLQVEDPDGFVVEPETKAMVKPGLKLPPMGISSSSTSSGRYATVGSSARKTFVHIKPTSSGSYRKTIPRKLLTSDRTEFVGKHAYRMAAWLKENEDTFTLLGGKDNVFQRLVHETNSAAASSRAGSPKCRGPVCTHRSCSSFMVSFPYVVCMSACLYMYVCLCVWVS